MTKDLPRSLPAVVFVVLHIPQEGASLLPELLGRVGALPVEAARDGAPFLMGHMYIAPQGHHLLVSANTMRLGRGPKENGHRPAVDPLFRSAARNHGSRVIRVILSGSDDDGAAGLQFVKARGGVAIVQDPADASFREMPRSAAAATEVDASLPVAQIGGMLTRLVREDGVAAASSPGIANSERREAAKIARDKQEQEQGERMNDPSVLSCPDCGGVLWEMQEGTLVRYRCHVGHSYSFASLDVQKAEALETALWTAVRMFRERAMLGRRSAARAQDRGMHFLVANLERRAEDADRCATLIEGLLGHEHLDRLSSPESPEPG